MIKQIILCLAFCQLAFSSSLTVVSQTSVIDEPKLQSNQSCVICEFVIHILEDLAVDNFTEPEVEKLLELICNNLFPVPIRSECSAFVAQYGKIVISLLVNGIDPAKVCRTILLCPKTQDPKPQPQPEPEPVKPLVVIDSVAKNESLECSLCLYFTQFVQDLLNNNKTDAEIAKELEAICLIFPTDLKNQCNAFLGEYLPEVIRLIDAEIQPEQACAFLKLCPKGVIHDIYKREFVNKLTTKNNN